MLVRMPAAAVVALLVGVFTALTCAQGTPAFVVAHPWAGSGQWLRADLHMHSRFSDGAQSYAALVAGARARGCDVVAVADHADRKLRGASAEHMAALTTARAAHPGLVIIAGLEWNIPPWGGEEHATVLVPDTPDEGAVLAEFKRQWDDFDLAGAPKPVAGEALAWLATETRGAPVKPVVVYNHPSRADAASVENVDDIRGWRAVNDLVIGFEAGPGHQGANPLASYKYKERPIDRWDPVAARPGDGWDQLLARGLNVHAAMASSDFHNDNPKDLNDFWPCQFSETWIYAPDRSVTGVLRALRAGTFVGVHGRVGRSIELTVEAAGLARPAMPGEHVRLPSARTVTARLNADVPALDWQDQPNQLDAIEFIVTTAAGTVVRVRPVSGVGAISASEPIAVPASGAVVRARGRRIVPDGPDLLFYTNAIRVSVGK